MLAELGIDADALVDQIVVDIERMLGRFVTGPANRNIYWLSLYGNPITADLVLHAFTEDDWELVRNSDRYAGWDARSLTAPFDGVRWSCGDCRIGLDDWSAPIGEALWAIAADRVEFTAGRPLDEDEENELWSEFDDIVVAAAATMPGLASFARLDRTTDFFVSTCGEDLEPDSLARRVRRSLGPDRFGELFPAECMVAPALDPDEAELRPRLHALLSLAGRLANDDEVRRRWNEHSPTLTGLEDELVDVARATVGGGDTLRTALPGLTADWRVTEMLLAALDRTEQTGSPALNGW